MKRTAIASLILITCLGAAWMMKTETGAPTMAERNTIAQAALQAGAAAPAWPATEKALIQEFWTGIATKNWERVLVLCPGATEQDFAPYVAMTPGPINAIGKPEPHPTEPGVLLWPVQIPFPGFPNKVIKMAILKTPDSRLYVDGRYTIWW